MSKIMFRYMNIETIIIDSDCTVFQILENYSHKINIPLNKLYFSYQGKQLSIKENLNKKIKCFNKKNIKINVFYLNKKNNNEFELKHIICPDCKNLAIISNKEDKINFDGCRNNHHYDNITLSQFTNSQNTINKSNIKCMNCKNKISLFNNRFYICSCMKKFCPLCYEIHISKSKHNAIEYNDRHFKCINHKCVYVSYCNTCKINICIFCEKDHAEHKTTLFKKINLNEKKLNDIEKNVNEIDKKIKQYELELNKMNDIFGRITKGALYDLQIYKGLYQLFKFFIDNYKNGLKNYESLLSFNNLDIKKLIKSMDMFLNDNLLNKFQYLINKYNLSLKELTLVYNNKNNEDKIRLFGEDFVKNNKNNCYILINNHISELCEFYNCDKKKKEKEIIVHLIKEKRMSIKGIFNNCKNLVNISNISKWSTHLVNDMSNMFYGCSSLLSLPDISSWITINVKNMSNMFYGCSSLSSLPDISIWRTNSAIDMSSMFYECSSLKSLPDISKWNTNNVKNMSSMFSKCKSLISLPNISKWNTNKVTNMSNMFSYCSSLSSLPGDISNWNLINTKDISFMFSFCSSLISLPDISNWNTGNVIDMGGFLNNCSLLKYIPNISNWNTEKVLYLNGFFSYCNSLEKLPKSLNWNTKKVVNMNALFYNCISLKYLPDISKWNTSKVINMKCMFSNCTSLIKLPDISSWNTSMVTNMRQMFYKCSSLIDLPDISKWDIKKVIDKTEMFFGCKNSIKIPVNFTTGKI